MTDDRDSEFYIEKPVAPREARRGRGPYSIANAAADAIKKISPKYGFASADIITNWAAICGAEAAKMASPLRIARKTLYVKLNNAAFATLFQFQSAAIIDRVNAYFGYKGVERVRVDVK